MRQKVEWWVPEMGGGGWELRFKSGQSFSLGGKEGYGDGRRGLLHKNMSVFNTTESCTCICVCMLSCIRLFATP